LAAPATKLQRSSGAVRVSFKTYGTATVLDALYQSGCYKVRFPRATAEQPPEAILINTAGGLTDGDTLSCAADWQPDTAALLTTQAAERIYRSRAAAAHIDTQLDIGQRATACWLPQETILFDGGRLNRSTSVRMCPDARLFAAETVVFGRTGMGEVTRSGRLFDSWRIRVDDKLVFADTVLFDALQDETLVARLAHRSVANAAHCMATLVYVADDCATRIDAVRAALQGSAVVAGASHLGPLIVARVVAGSSHALRAAILGVFAATQHECAAQRFDVPRVWHC